MSWDRMHRRHEMVHAVLAGIEGSGIPEVPDRLRADVDAEFGDFGGFLREVQRRWYRTFEARLDALLEDWPADMRTALVRLWRDVADVMPVARFLLDAHVDHPALTPLDDHHGRLLHAATGVHLDVIREAVAPPSPSPSSARWVASRN